MLQQIRDLTRNPVVRWVFIIFLVVPFGLFGIDAYLNRVSSGEALAKVGPASISQFEYDQAVREQADMYRRQFGNNFDGSIMENPEIRRAVLERLVNEKVIAIGAQEAGVTLPDNALAERISREPFFQQDGRFSKERFDQIAQAQGLTPVGLEERLRADYRQQQFRASIAETTIIPNATLDAFIRLSEQTREVSVVNFTPEAYLPKVNITPEQVKAWYDGHPAEYTTPEQVRVEYVELSLDALAARATVPAEEVKRAYEDGMARNQWGKAEERRASHILITAAADAKEPERKAAREKAQAIADAVRKAPKTFADVAKKESQDPGSAPQGGDLGFFSRGAMVKPFEDAAFAAAKGEIVGPVASDFGFHVIVVTDVKPAEVKSLAEATPEIEAQLKKQVASRQFAESAENFANMVYEQSTSLKPVSESLGLEIRQSPFIGKGQPAPQPFGNAKLMAEVFSDDAIKAKRNTTAIEVAPNTLVSARVLEHKPAQLRPLEEVRAEIEAKLKREEAMKLARAEGEAKLKALQEGKDAGLKWPAPLAVNRQKPGGLPPQVVERAFRVDARKLPAHAGTESPVGYSVVRVTKVIEVEKIDDDRRRAMAQQVRQAVGLVELDATLASLRNDIGVTVRAGAIERKEEPQ